MDVLRKELNSFYASQCLDREELDEGVLDAYKEKLTNVVEVTKACCVITDASADRSYIISGSFARFLGITDVENWYKSVNSSDEDIIYNRLHPEDLVEKRMLEYEFFKYVDSLDDDGKLNPVARCRIRIKNNRDEYVYIANSTQVLHKSPRGKVWLILCCYDLSPEQTASVGISPRIVNNATGEIKSLSFADRRAHLLTFREKEVLHLIKEGKPSKLIATQLGISINTVNRHRQNILEKLNVGNSLEAIMAASAMKLL